MLVVPTLPIPNQTLQVQLADQPCTIDVYQTAFGIFLNLAVNDVAIINGVICEDRNRIVRSAYLGFIGDLAFLDTQGLEDPFYTGLGGRFQLVYFDVADLAGV